MRGQAEIVKGAKIYVTDGCKSDSLASLSQLGINVFYDFCNRLVFQIL